jgi:hypothetical protein
MTYRTKRPRKQSQREIRNTLTWYAGGTEMEAPTQRTGPQAENETNKAVGLWATYKPDLFIARNKRRLATPVGYDKPIMLGWLVDGSPDWIGWQSVTITPSMVGRRAAIFVGIEAKRPVGGTLSPAQEYFLNTLKDAGGISGVARNAEDAERVLAEWRARL